MREENSATLSQEGMLDYLEIHCVVMDLVYYEVRAKANYRRVWLKMNLTEKRDTRYTDTCN